MIDNFVMTILPWFVVAMFIGFIMTRVKIHVVKVSNKDIENNPELKKMFFKKHPGAEWIYDFLESMDKVDKHIKDCAEEAKSADKASTMHMLELIMVMSTGQGLLHECYKKVHKIPIRKADRIVRKYGKNGATEKYFGEFIEDFYFTTFVIDKILEEAKNGEEVHDHHEVFEECKARAHAVRMGNVEKTA